MSDSDEPSPKIFSPTDRVSKYYSQRAKQITARFDVVRELINNEGTKGTRVEKEVREFLLQFLPGRYTYTSGIVVDFSGGEQDFSKQEDLLIVDRLFNPNLFIEGEPSIYPVDVIYSGIEIKTCLTSTELTNAIEIIASLKRLKYIKRSVAQPGRSGLHIRQTSPPIGVIFAFDSDIRRSETILHHLSNCASKLPRSEWPDLICILNRGILGFDSDDKAQFGLCGLLGNSKSGLLAEVISKLDGEHFDHVGIRYPTVLMDKKKYVVDVGRTLTAFLAQLYEFLLSKVLVSQQNLLVEFIPEELRRVLYKDKPIQAPSE